VKTFWRWTGTIFFALAFIFLTVAGIGTSIPIWHSTKCRADIAAPSDALFGAIADDGSSASWRPELRSVTLVSGSGPTSVWRETYKSGQVLTLHTNPRGFEQGRLVVREIPFDPSLGFDGIWQFGVGRSGQRGGQTRVAINEQGHIYNPVFRFLTKYVFGYTGSIRTYLEDLGTKFGEKTTIACISSQ
jgi:polyketide cyclase/dehydrase/lipid transport protein